MKFCENCGIEIGGKDDENLTIYHRDGTVTYWAVYEQRWHRRAEAVPDRELAARPQAEARRIQLHLRPPAELIRQAP